MALADASVRALAALLKSDPGAIADVVAHAGGAGGQAKSGGEGQESAGGGVVRGLVAVLASGREGVMGNAALALQLIGGLPMRKYPV